MLRVLLTAIAILSLVGCSESVEVQEVQDSGPGSILSRSVEFSSIAEMAAASELVVTARTVEVLTAEDIRRLPLTTTSVLVQQVHKGLGSVTGSTIRVQQIGRLGQGQQEESSLLEPGRTYVLFIKHFILETDPVAPDLYVPVGVQAGVYALSGSRFVRTDPESPRLPATFAPADLDGLLGN